MKPLILTTIFLVIAFLNCPAQENNLSENKPPVKLSTKGDWKLPLNEEREGLLSTQNLVVDDYPVKVETYKLSKPYVLPLNPDVNKTPPRISNIEVKYFSIYSADGKYYGIKIGGVWVEIAEDGSKTYFGTFYYTYFGDEDGDGVFETRYRVGLPDKIPDWIPKDADKIIKPLQKPPEWKLPSGN